MAISSAESKDSVRTPGWRASSQARVLVAAVSLAAVVAVGAAAALAGSCRVLLALGSVEIEPSPAGLSLRLSGSWEFDNLVQVASGLSYNVLLVRKDHFVRFHYPDQAFTGSLSGLGSAVDAGLSGSEIVALEAAGAAQANARFVSVEAHRMKLTSPLPQGTGPISVLAYLVLDDDYVSPVISNTITRPVELLDGTVNSDGSDTGEVDPGTDPSGDPIEPIEPIEPTAPGDQDDSGSPGAATESAP